MCGCVENECGSKILQSVQKFIQANENSNEKGFFERVIFFVITDQELMVLSVCCAIRQKKSNRICFSCGE